MTDRLDVAVPLPPVEAVDAVPLEALPAFVLELAALQARAAARLAVSKSESKGADDRLIAVDQAAERLGVTRDWLRRRPELPFVVKLSEGVVRYSSRGIDAYIATGMWRRF